MSVPPALPARLVIATRKSARRKWVKRHAAMPEADARRLFREVRRGGPGSDAT